MSRAITEALPRLGSAMGQLPEPQIPSVNGEKPLAFRLHANGASAPLGELFLHRNRVDAIGIIPSNTTNFVIDAAIQRTKDQNGALGATKQLVIAPNEAAERIRSAVPDVPVFGSEQLRGLVKQDELHTKYGTTLPEEDTVGMQQLGALIVDRLILQRTSDRGAQYNHITTNPEAVLTPPYHQAALLVRQPNILYVQKHTGENGHAAEQDNETLDDVVTFIQPKDLQPSNNAMLKRQLVDHQPISTGRHGQEVVGLIAAQEYAHALGLPVADVMDMMGVTPTGAELLRGDKAQEFEELTKAIGQECHAKGIRFIDAKPEHYRAMNATLQHQQLVPSLYTLTRDHLIDVDAVTAVEKQLHKKQFPGISPAVRAFMPNNMKEPERTDDIHTLIEDSDKANLQFRIKPPDDIVVNTDKMDSFDHETGARVRDIEHHQEIDPRGQLNTEVHEHALFNLERFNLDANTSETQELENIAQKRLQEGDICSVLPAYIERLTAGDVARYHQELLPSGLVIVTSKDRQTREAAAPHADVVVNEEEVLSFVNWGYLKEQGIIPADRKLKWGKGRTLLSGYLYALATGRLTKDMLLDVGDTDVASSNQDGLFYRDDGKYFPNFPKDRSHIPSYRYLEYAAAALALMPANYQINAVQGAKTGPERENIMQLNLTERLINWELEDDAPTSLQARAKHLRDVGRALKRVVHPSPGDALVQPDVYRHGAWDLTTTFDLWRHYAAYYDERGILRPEDKARGVQPQDTRRTYAQVSNPGIKIEIGGIKYPDDIIAAGIAKAMQHHAADLYQELAQKEAWGIGSLPPELPPGYTIDHVRAWNQRHAGKEEEVLGGLEPDFGRDENGVPVYKREDYFKGGHGPNRSRHIPRSIFMPSVEWMDQMGLINWEGIRNVENHSTREQRKKTIFT